MPALSTSACLRALHGPSCTKQSVQYTQKLHLSAWVACRQRGCLQSGSAPGQATCLRCAWPYSPWPDRQRQRYVRPSCFVGLHMNPCGKMQSILVRVGSTTDCALLPHRPDGGCIHPLDRMQCADRLQGGDKVDQDGAPFGSHVSPKLGAVGPSGGKSTGRRWLLLQGRDCFCYRPDRMRYVCSEVISYHGALSTVLHRYYRVTRKTGLLIFFASVELII